MSFRNADLRYAVVGRTVSALGDAATVLALTLGLASRGPWAVAVLMVAGFTPALIMAPLAGVLVDRRDSRRLLVGAGVLQVGLSVALAFAPWFPLVLALLFLLGACQAVVGATWTSLAPALVGREGMARALGTLQAWSNGALVLGPALGGLLVGLGGIRTALLLDTSTFVIATIAALRVQHRRQVEPTGESDRFRDGVAGIAADPVLRSLVAMMFVFVVLCGAANVADVFLVRGTLHAGATAYGLVTSVFGAAMVVGSVLSGRVRGESQLARGAVLSMVMLAAYLLGAATTPSVAVLLPWMVLGGLGNALLNICVGTLLALRVPEEVRGRVAAAIGGLMSGGMLLSMLAGGLLTSLLDPREVFGLCALAGLSAPVLLGHRLLVTAARPPLPTSRCCAAETTEPRRSSTSPTGTSAVQSSNGPPPSPVATAPTRTTTAAATTVTPNHR